MFAQGKLGIAGVWRDQSFCERKESACREETAVLRPSPLQDKAGSFSASADKIVKGKAVNMGIPTDPLPNRSGPMCRLRPAGAAAGQEVGVGSGRYNPIRHLLPPGAQPPLRDQINDLEPEGSPWLSPGLV